MYICIYVYVYMCICITRIYVYMYIYLVGIIRIVLGWDFQHGRDHGIVVVHNASDHLCTRLWKKKIVLHLKVVPIVNNKKKN